MSRESGQVYCKKTITLLPINCRILKLFPEGVATDQTTRRRTFQAVETPWTKVYPKSQNPKCSRSFYNLDALAKTPDYFLSQRLWYILASAWKQINSLFMMSSPNCLFRICCLPLRFTFVLHIPEDDSTITSLEAWKNLSMTLSLFSESIQIHHHSRQEWHHESHRLHHSFWQI